MRHAGHDLFEYSRLGTYEVREVQHLSSTSVQLVYCFHHSPSHVYGFQKEKRKPPLSGTCVSGGQVPGLVITKPNSTPQENIPPGDAVLKSGIRRT